jgi:protein-disulfide isomerase
MIEFSDFQCPFCLSAFPTVQRVLDLRRQNPFTTATTLPNHPNAARPPGAACAASRTSSGSTDRLFQNQSKLGAADSAARRRPGIDANAFNACVDSQKFSRISRPTSRRATPSGVNGTPAFFINSRSLSGAQPFDAFKRVIDEELARR